MDGWRDGWLEGGGRAGREGGRGGREEGERERQIIADRYRAQIERESKRYREI
ncbi:hypothetical protein DPMN_180007 [Dreissena polymorpha]|uniref:Uncharacterized protein n=1 Tax=Dreissena polymorpha TaxID=45954 RepID=A0A9D4EDW9_DREPO|nr:hypothetical protein DPMN_180007 [Dreissena polymorpha]